MVFYPIVDLMKTQKELLILIATTEVLFFSICPFTLFSALLEIAHIIFKKLL